MDCWHKVNNPYSKSVMTNIAQRIDYNHCGAMMRSDIHTCIENSCRNRLAKV